MKTLLSNDLRDRLTIVISSNDLRQRGARLSTGLSWDRAIEEIVAEFREGASAYDLGNCRRVIVYFGSAGAASFTRCRLKLTPPPGWSPDQPITGINQLHEAGYAIQHKSPQTPASATAPNYEADDRERLYKIEHDVWVRNKMLDGYQWQHHTNDSLYLHRAITPFDQLLPEDRKLDMAIVDRLPKALWEHRFELVKQP